MQVPAIQNSFVPAGMTAQLLKKLLKAFGLPLAGSHAKLEHRLQKALAAAARHGRTVQDEAMGTIKTQAVGQQPEPAVAASNGHAAAMSEAAMSHEVRADTLPGPTNTSNALLSLE